MLYAQNDTVHSKSREWAQISTELPIIGCVQIQAETLFDREDRILAIDGLGSF